MPIAPLLVSTTKASFPVAIASAHLLPIGSVTSALPDAPVRTDAPTADAPADNGGPAPSAELRDSLVELAARVSHSLDALQDNVSGAEAAQRDATLRLDRSLEILDRWSKEHVLQLDQRMQDMQQQLDAAQAQAADDRRRIAQMSVQLAVHDQSVTSYGRTSDEVRDKFTEVSRSSSLAGKIVWSIAGSILLLLLTLQVTSPQKLLDLVRAAEAALLSSQP